MSVYIHMIFHQCFDINIINGATKGIGSGFSEFQPEIIEKALYGKTINLLRNKKVCDSYKMNLHGRY